MAQYGPYTYPVEYPGGWTWSYEKGWYDRRDGSPLVFWEPIPISLARFVLSPDSGRARMMLAVQIGILGGMSAFTYLLSGQMYRSTTGIAIEAMTGTSGGGLAILAASTILQREYWQDIGDEKTGAIHYSGAGLMTGGSMPVVSGDGRHPNQILPDWDDLVEWWENL
jgi:hypothetical protein